MQGKDIKLGSKGNVDEIKLAQESLELVRLRLEQVGFSNKAVWGGSIKDANVADGLVRKNRLALISAAGTRGSIRFIRNRRIKSWTLIRFGDCRILIYSSILILIGDEAATLIDTKLLPTITSLVDSLRKQDIVVTNKLQVSYFSSTSYLWSL
jgi:hypothetical protein